MHKLADLLERDRKYLAVSIDYCIITLRIVIGINEKTLASVAFNVLSQSLETLDNGKPYTYSFLADLALAIKYYR